MWKTKTFILIAVICGVGCIWAMRYAAEQRKECLRLGRNQAALLENVREYKLRDSLNAAAVSTMTMKTKEFEKGFMELKSLLKDLKIRTARVENISRNALNSRYEIKAPVGDTVVPVKETSAMAEAQAVKYYSPHIELDGVIAEGEFKGSVVTYDTLTQIVHRVPKKFLFIKYGTKELRQEVISSNPHTRITYSRSIKIKK